MLGIGIILSQKVARKPVEILQAAREDDYQERGAYDFYEALCDIPGYKNKAVKLFWERRALFAEANGNRDEAFLLRLKALAENETDSRRRNVGCFVATDYNNLLATFRLNSNIVALTFSSNGDTIRFNTSDGTIWVFQAKENATIWEPIQRNWLGLDDVLCLSPDGKKVVTKSYATDTRLWNLESDTASFKPMSQIKDFIAVAFSPNNKTLVTWTDGTAQLWDAEKSISIREPMRHEGNVKSVVFSPDGKIVATGSKNEMRLWRAEDGVLFRGPIRGAGNIIVMSFSPDSKTVATGSDNGIVQLWNAETGIAIGKAIYHKSSIQAIAFSRDEMKLLIGSKDGIVQLWQIENGAPIGKPMRHEGSVITVAFEPNDKFLVIGCDDGIVRLWSMRNLSDNLTCIRHEKPIRATVFSMDGRTLLTGSSDGTAQLWRVEDGLPYGEPMRNEGSVTAMAFSPDDKIIATRSDKGIVQLWNAKTCKAIGEPIKYQSRVDAISFNSDGKIILIGSKDGTAQLWSVETGKSIGKPFHHENSIDEVALSPNNKTLLTIDYNAVEFNSGDNFIVEERTAQLWSVETGKLVGGPLNHESGIVTAAFSPDNKTVITASDRGTIQLWNAENGENIGKPRDCRRGIEMVRFSPDGNTIMTATKWWVHKYFADNDTSLSASRLLSGSWTGAYRFLDKSGNTIQVALRLAGNVIKIDTLRFDLSDITPIQGRPKNLLETWQSKLALQFNEYGSIKSTAPELPLFGSRSEFIGVSSLKYYTVMVGSFRTREQASNFARSLREKNINNFVMQVNGVLLVCVGKYVSAPRADRMANSLKNYGFGNAVVLSPRR